MVTVVGIVAMVMVVAIVAIVAVVAGGNTRPGSGEPFEATHAYHETNDERRTIPRDGIRRGGISRDEGTAHGHSGGRK
jgi:hypothetical protein